MSSNIKGLDAVTKNLQAAINGLKHKSSRGLADAALFIAGEAQRRAPVESGDLRGSVRVSFDGDICAQGTIDGKDVEMIAPLDGTETEAKISFSGPYAAKQHEDMSLRHDKSDGYRIPEYNKRTGKKNKHAGQSYNRVAGGQAKYLESVLVEEQDRILRLIAGETGGGDD